MSSKMLYKIKPKNHNEKDLKKIIADYPEIKFVSLMGIDLYGNGTEEKIPIKVFEKNMDDFLHKIAVQTDGSSVALPGIATLNDAKIDMVVDLECDWFIDYNEELMDEETLKPIGTIIIPAFLYHAGVPVDSRSILKLAEKTFKQEVLKLLKDNKPYLEKNNVEDINSIELDTAAELEFWVKTPNDKAEIEALTTSECLQEQYWTKINGPVRTALEETLILMEKYELEPEMGHKEVGGIKAKLDSAGRYNHVMEQLEIDWRYSTPMQTADNQVFIKNLVQETFLKNGLETTFMSKPIEDVAGNGMHLHLGAKARTKDNKKINIFNGSEEHFLGEIGYGALMGLLKNYEIMNPFISSTYDSLKRLKPGYEAPVCIVTSLGTDVKVPSRNRTVLISLIKDSENKMATRFELRSPNPKSNIYLSTAVSYLTMLDGIKYAVQSKKTEDELLKELSKKQGEESEYLEKNREYRSEEDVFEYYTDEQRNSLFGEAPKSIYENIQNLEKYQDKLETLKVNDVFTDKIINSFKISVIKRWKEEMCKRIITEYTNEIREYKSIHIVEKALDNDIARWTKINEIRKYIAKDSTHYDCVFTRIKRAIKEENYLLASDLSVELENKMEVLRKLYSEYSKNILDF